VIENALKYAPGSPVEVEVRSGGGYARVTMRDRGPGMSATDAEHAFEPFLSRQRAGFGRRLGPRLAIAKRAVERAAGIIALESIPGGNRRYDGISAGAGGGAALAFRRRQDDRP